MGSKKEVLFSTAFEVFQAIHVSVYCPFVTLGCNCPELSLVLGQDVALHCVEL